MDKTKNNTLRTAFFDHSEDPFCLFDEDLNYTDVNDAFEKTFGFQRAEVIGKNLAVVSPAARETGRYAMYEQVLKTGKSITIDVITSHPETGYICSRIIAFKVENCLGIVLTGITDLREKIEDLDAFVYKASHDMRSPLARVLGLLSLVETEPDLEKARHYLQLIKEQSERLDSLLRNFVITAKTGKDKAEPVNFTEVTDHVIGALSFAEGFEKVTFKKDITFHKPFNSYKILINAVLQNLIENAIKYRKQAIPDPVIAITIYGTRDKAILKIQDNGIGISPGDQGKVFSSFFRATENQSCFP